MNIFFPYEKVREIQEDFIKDILDSIQQKRHLIAHAPTGIGKTASVLSTIIPYIIEKDLTLFFLTSRHTQHRIAIETLKDIKKKHGVNADINVADLIGKKNMCSQFGVEAMGSQFYEFCRTIVEKKECEFYENTYSSIGYSFETRNFLTNNKGIFHVEEFLDLAKKTRLCPYELAILKAKKANIIIADYSYVFNPNIRESFFRKSNKFLEKSVIVIDEAHNLPGRLRDIMSSSLTTFVIERAVKEAENYKEAFAVLQKIKEKFDNICNTDNERLVKKEEFIFNDFAEFIGLLDAVADNILEEKKRSFVGGVSEFLKMWNGANNGFVRYIEKSSYKDKENFKLHYKCLDPSLLTKEIVENSLMILMSGTLTPLEMYRDLLGIKNAVLKEYTNPFPKENKMSLIVPETTTKFTKRSLAMYKLIAEKCASFSNLINGNILVFFPSYHVMNEVFNFYREIGNKTLFVEKQGISKEEKEELLKKFKSYKSNGAVLFAVSGASFSEGIDLPGDELKAVIIVGLPLSRPDLETRSLIEYYDERFGKGWDYGYIFPAMKKVIQGAGRCIRSETDKGIIIFLDERYSMSNYFRCFPKDYNVKITKLPEEHIKKFLEN